MKVSKEEFWKRIIDKMIDRVDHDKTVFGESYIEIVCDKHGRLTSLNFVNPDRVEEKKTGLKE